MAIADFRHEVPLLSIPVTAIASRNGFGEWRIANSIARHLRASFSQTNVYLETTGGVAIEIPPAASTWTGFRDWVFSPAFPKQGRFSYIDSEILIDMSPEEGETHNKVKTEITRVLSNLSRESQAGVLYSDRLWLSGPQDLSTEPDAMFVSYDSFQSGAVQRVERAGSPGEYVELKGAADWVLEVVSHSSMAKDTLKMRVAYHKAGVREYWLVNARGPEIDFRILEHGEVDYVTVTPVDGWHSSRVVARSFRLSRHRDPIGLWQYNLEAKAG